MDMTSHFPLLPYRCRIFLPFVLVLATVQLLFTACSSADTPVAPPEEGNATVCFTVSNYRQVSFDDLSSVSGTRAEVITMTLAHLQLSVFDATTMELVTPTILHKASEYETSAEKAKTFPEFQLNLPYGRYKILVLGYNGQHECQLQSPSDISWPDGYVPNTFRYYGDLVINGSTQPQQSIRLEHCVAAFRILSDEPFPNGVRKIRFTTDGGGTVLDATTGLTAKASGRCSEIVVPASMIGHEVDALTTYLFLPSETISTKYKVEVLGEKDVVMFTHDFDEVPMKINQMTIWSGKLFVEQTPTVSQGFGITWNMDWGNEVHI